MCLLSFPCIIYYPSSGIIPVFPPLSALMPPKFIFLSLREKLAFAEKSNTVPFVGDAEKLSCCAVVRCINPLQCHASVHYTGSYRKECAQWRFYHVVQYISFTHLYHSSYHVRLPPHATGQRLQVNMIAYRQVINSHNRS